MLVCRPKESDEHYEESYWRYLVNALGLTEVPRSEIGSRPVIVVQPISGKEVYGTVPLNEFSHLSEAVYLFGANHRHMTEEDLKGLIVIARVHIPSVADWELFNSQAAAIVAWDWRLHCG